MVGGDQVSTRRADAAQSQRTVFCVAVIVVLGMLLADLPSILFLMWAEGVGAAPGFTWHDLLFLIAVPATVGLLASQLILAVGYSALGDGSGPRRVLYTTFVVALFTNILLFFTIWWLKASWHNWIAVFLVPMVFFFLLQIPLWGIRSCYGWTILSPWSEPRECRRLRFSIADTLGWCVFLAVPLCILRALTESMTGLIGFGILFICLFALVLCPLLMVFLYIALAANFGVWKSSAACSLALLGAVAFQLLVGYLANLTMELEVVMIFLGVNFSAGGVLFLCLMLARRLGFRLLPFEAKRLRHNRS